jgi:hypothetical protein
MLRAQIKSAIENRPADVPEAEWLKRVLKATMDAVTAAR